MPLVQERTLADLRHNDMLTGYAAIVKFWRADYHKDQTPLNRPLRLWS